MLLHIAEDEKFIDPIIKALDNLAPSQNIFLIRIPSPDYKLKYIKSPNIICATYNSIQYNEIIEKYKFCSAIVFHNFINRYKWNLIKKLPPNTKKVWIAWGADLYGSAKFANSFYKPLTKKHTRRLQKETSTLKGPYKDMLFYLGSQIPLVWRVKLGISDNIENYFKYIDYICPVIYEDYLLLKKHYPKTPFEFLQFSYNVDDSLFSNINQPITSGKNIIVGNSASPVNNHLDVFELLKTVKLRSDQKVIVPLSYGGDQLYIDAVLESGKKYFKNQFMPIMDFLPQKDYQSILESVGFGFFNSLRQHAMGNIYTLLFMGAKIFIDEKNPSYNFLKRNNLNFSSLNQATANLHLELKQPLSETDIKSNRDFLFKEFETSNYEKKLARFINELKK